MVAAGVCEGVMETFDVSGLGADLSLRSGRFVNIPHYLSNPSGRPRLRIGHPRPTGLTKTRDRYRSPIRPTDRARLTGRRLALHCRPPIIPSNRYRFEKISVCKEFSCCRP